MMEKFVPINVQQIVTQLKLSAKAKSYMEMNQLQGVEPKIYAVRDQLASLQENFVQKSQTLMVAQ